MKSVSSLSMPVFVAEDVLQEGMLLSHAMSFLFDFLRKFLGGPDISLVISEAIDEDQ